MSVQYNDRVFVGNLHTSVQEEELLWYIQYQLQCHPSKLWPYLSAARVLCLTGSISGDAKIIRDFNGRSKGYGFVDLESSPRGQEEARTLIEKVIIV